ncbi:hypothetical protein FA95DRAFT_1578804, partial [Auriscalpium vulgare]
GLVTVVVEAVVAARAEAASSFKCSSAISAGPGSLTDVPCVAAIDHPALLDEERRVEALLRGAAVSSSDVALSGVRALASFPPTVRTGKSMLRVRGVNGLMSEGEGVRCGLARRIISVCVLSGRPKSGGQAEERTRWSRDILSVVYCREILTL